MHTRLRAVLLLLPVVLGACILRGDDPNLTESGLGRPLVTVSFPEESTPGSTQTAVLKVTNPGPGDMTSVVVAFAALGDPRLPRAIVGTGAEGRNPAVVRVDPIPEAVSSDGVVYTFGALEEEATIDLRFELVVPEAPGFAANSVTVYDGQAVDRAKGVRLETTVE